MMRELIVLAGMAPDLCKHCHLFLDQHQDGKCLMDSTMFEAMSPTELEQAANEAIQWMVPKPKSSSIS